METGSLINKLQEFLNDHDIKIDQELLSTSLKELNFSKTLGLLDMIKDRDIQGVAELLNINYDAPVTEEGSPWTTTGKHPEDMDADELRDELAVFDELRDRGDYLSPQELAREDTLWDYLEQIDGPQVQYEAYGTVGTRQPSASRIQAQTTSDNNNQRDFTNNQQDQQRDATAVQRTVAGGNKQATGQGAARYDKRQDPDDVQRGQNAAQSNANAQLANQNAAEIERLKQLAYGRR
jgi:hypothetical protein